MSFLIEITPREFNVTIDLAYATPNNFTGKPVYRADARCYLNADATEHFRRAIELAAQQNMRFHIFDAFRPAEAQQKLWDHTPDPNFLADPKKGSPHSRGAAIDLTLVDIASGQHLDMGTEFDAFTPLSHHGNMEIPADAQRNRLLLMGIMTTAGWDFYRNEWWHYQLFDARAKYPLLSSKDAPYPLMD